MKRIDHVGIVVACLDDAVATFVDLLGMTLVSKEERPHLNLRFAFVAAENGSMLELVEREDQASLGDALGMLDHVAMEVDDLDTTVDELRGAGFEFTRDAPNVTQRPTGPSRSMVTQPSTSIGLRLQFVENEHLAAAATMETHDV